MWTAKGEGGFLKKPCHSTREGGDVGGRSTWTKFFTYYLNTSVPPILPKFSDQKMGSRRVVGWYKKPENYFGFILPIKPRSP